MQCGEKKVEYSATRETKTKVCKNVALFINYLLDHFTAGLKLRFQMNKVKMTGV